MKRHYIFLTHEGLTKTPNNEDIENLQVLGTSDGENETDAFNNFVEETQYLSDTDFNEIFALELTSKKQFHFDLKEN